MKENNDTDAFDLDKSEIVENRSYIDNAKLIHQVNSKNNGTPLANDYLLKEQKRLKATFDKLYLMTHQFE